MNHKFIRSALMWLLVIFSVLGLIPMFVVAADNMDQASKLYLPIVTLKNLLTAANQDNIASGIPTAIATPPPVPADFEGTPVPFDQLPICPDNLGPLTPMPDFSAAGGCRALSTHFTKVDGNMGIPLPGGLATSTVAPPVTPIPPAPGLDNATPVPFEQLPICPDNLGPLTPTPDFSTTGGCRVLSTPIITVNDNMVIILPTVAPIPQGSITATP